MEEALRWSKNVVSAKFVNKKNLKENKLFAQANFEAIFVFIHFDKPLLVLKSFKKLLKANHNDFDTKLMALRVLIYCKIYLIFSRKSIEQKRNSRDFKRSFERIHWRIFWWQEFKGLPLRDRERIQIKEQFLIRN